ncbi:MAG: relaxase/mobilization nuclease domain-containing protein [Dehalococcoidia bacterium]|nr:relaxase/mobilization nuclease domain-containing protein [Dehalococcoidia bacterium]
MATTWLKALHTGTNSIDYVLNATKTDSGHLIDSYECNPLTAQAEFLLSKQLYSQVSGRDRGKHSVTAYHMRMSFKHGEVTAKEALHLGMELAKRWTKGKHQFIAASHINTKNPHTHIIFNSVNLDCERKFNDFKRSAIALRRVSDRICLEHGLSVIEKPALSQGYNRDEYLGEKKPLTVREQLKQLIDKSITTCNDFKGFIANLEACAVEIKHGKQLAFKIPASKKFCRMDTLGENYSIDSINKRISNKHNLLLDIQTRIQKRYKDNPESDLKDISKTLLFLKDRNVTTYELLTEKVNVAVDTFGNHNGRRKVIEGRMAELDSLLKHIAAYAKTVDIFRTYKEGGFSNRFYSVHKAEINAHREAKKAFLALGLERLPSADSLRKEYISLDAERKTLSRGYKPERDEMIAFLRAKDITDNFLFEPERRIGKTHEREEL